MDEVLKTVRGPTKDRWLTAIKDKAHSALKALPLAETRAEHFLKALHEGTVATTVEPHADLRIGFEYAAHWRHRKADAFYLSPGIDVPGTAGSGRFIGHHAQVNVNWAATPNLSVQAAYARFFASASLEQAGGRSSDFFVLNTSWKF